MTPSVQSSNDPFVWISWPLHLYELGAYVFSYTARVVALTTWRSRAKRDERKGAEIAAFRNHPKSLSVARDRSGITTRMTTNSRSSNATAHPRDGRSTTRMPDVVRFLLPTEELRYAERRHPIVLLPLLGGVVAIALVAGVAVVAAGAGPSSGVAGIVVIAAVLWFLYRVLRWSRVMLVVTDRRVFEVETLIMNRATIRPVFRQAVVFVQNPIGERLNFGTILTRMPNGDRVHTFRFIHNPRSFYAAVTDRAV